jgi:hypothetical protein
VRTETYQKLYRSEGCFANLTLINLINRFFASHNQIFFSLVQKYDFDWELKIKAKQEEEKGT